MTKPTGCPNVDASESEQPFGVCFRHSDDGLATKMETLCPLIADPSSFTRPSQQCAALKSALNC